MLKKIQNVWNFVLKKKKLSNNTNLYSIKNNFLFTNAINTSLVFYIQNLKSIKVKNIKVINKIITIFTFYNFIYLLFLLIFIAFIFIILYVY